MTATLPRHFSPSIANLPDAAPRSLDDLRRRPTSYAVLATNPAGETAVLGFTERCTQGGLIAVLRQRGDELVAVSGLTDDDAFTVTGGKKAEARFRGWTCRIAGVTERDIAQLALTPEA